MKVGVALRSTVFGPSSIAKIVPLLERAGVDSVWFPSGGDGFDALDMCAISLGMTHRLRAGTGVIRPADYDVPLLVDRVHTLSEGSGGRFILGMGTGAGTGLAAVDGLVDAAEKIRSHYPGQTKPPVFFATLRRRILRAAYLNAEGAILNLCSPKYVEKIAPRGIRAKGFTLACYIKLFFAEDVTLARRMLADELKRYNGIPQYHAMFEEMGASGSIDSLGSNSLSGIPEDLSEISSANPSDDEVSRMLERFGRAGVDLPVLYPYAFGDESYRIAVVERLISTLK